MDGLVTRLDEVVLPPSPVRRERLHDRGDTSQRGGAVNEDRQEDVPTDNGSAKKVTAIIGSPREGDAYRIVKMLEGLLTARGRVDFEYVLLKDCHIEPCTGCGLCMTEGEEHCPRKDDLAAVFSLLMRSDGVILATPGAACDCAL